MSWYNPGDWSVGGTSLADDTRKLGKNAAIVAPEVLGTAGMLIGGPAGAGLGAGLGTAISRGSKGDTLSQSLTTGLKAGVGVGVGAEVAGLGLNALEGATGSAGLDFTSGMGGGSALTGLANGISSAIKGGDTQSATSGISNFLGLGGSANTLLALGIPAAMIALAASQKPGALPNEKETTALAAQEAAAGKTAADAAATQMAQYNSGKLDAYQQQQVDQYTQQATASTKQTYANLGLSGSTMEGAELNRVSQNAMAMAASYREMSYTNAISALQTEGTLDTQSAAIYQQIATEKIQQDEDYQNAISEAAMAGAYMFGSMMQGGQGGQNAGGGSGGSGILSGIGNAIKGGYNWLTGSSGTDGTATVPDETLTGTQDVGTAGEGSSFWESTGGMPTYG
jgi:hypothetical protein